MFKALEQDVSGDKLEPVVKQIKWYESGTYIIVPDKIYWKIWVVFKSSVYLISIYQLLFFFAFKQYYWTPFGSVALFVQSLDAFLHFFTAVHVSEMTERALTYRQKILESRRKDDPDFQIETN